MAGLDALLHRPRPSAWTLFLRQPCVYLARLLYSWRPINSPQPSDDAVSVVCIADTHNHHLEIDLPDGDILIHAGDLTQSGTLKELEAAVAWLRRQPHAVKIVVAGNHELCLEREQIEQKMDWGDVVYLENEETTVTANGRQLRVYGSPLSPRHGNGAFQYPRTKNIWQSLVINPVDILVTHAPPRGHLDRQLGCAHLLQTLWRVRPRLHVFGHIHDGAGTERVQFDALQAAYEQTVLAGGGVLNLGRVFYCFVVSFLVFFIDYFRRAPADSCLLVNAAMLGGLRDNQVRRPVQVYL